MATGAGIMTQHGIPCLFMRGGTSRGPFFDLRDLPADPDIRDRVLLSAMGSPDARQIDGLGGATMLTSKIAMVTPSKRQGIDVDYLFAQVWLDEAIVDTTPSCGNMLAGVGPFALERGIIKTTENETHVNIFNVNTQSKIEAIVQTPGGMVTYAGNQHIDGVPGTGAPIFLNFTHVMGSKCGTLLPTGKTQEEINGIPVSCIDVAMPMVIMRANDLGIIDYEASAISSNKALMQRIENIRLEAGLRMGLGDVTQIVIPKVSILAQARRGGTVFSYYLTPHHMHAAHAVTGAICVASCTSIHNTVAETLTKRNQDSSSTVQIEHPSGAIDVHLEISGSDKNTQVQRAGIVRTARKIMDGELFVPANLWPTSS